MELNATFRLIAGTEGPTKKMLETLDEWQNYALAENAVQLKRQPWPEKYRHYRGILYRIIALSDKKLVETLNSGNLVSKPASWTKSLKVIKEYMTTHAFSRWIAKAGSDSAAVLLTYSPKSSEVILDIDSLWHDPSFKAWVEHYEDEGELSGGEGLDFQDSQKEVVLDTVHIKATQITLVPAWAKSIKFISPSEYMDSRESKLKGL